MQKIQVLLAVSSISESVSYNVQYYSMWGDHEWAINEF